MAKLHRARGVRRQGAGFSAARVERDAKAKNAFAFSEEAKSANLKGDARLLFVANKLGINTKGDYSEITRLISEGKKVKGKIE